MHPYATLDKKFFWAPAVGRREALEIDELWDPKFQLRRNHKIVTFGSCFAQHIGRALKKRRYAWHLTEPAPTGLSPESAKRFNYDVFTCRTGNIYTTTLFNQWTRWALGEDTPPDEIWEDDKGRVYDPFRPNVEPGGFASTEEMLTSRQVTIEAFRAAITEAKVFVFTLGLTESWFNTDGYEYPMCPGTVAGTFDGEKHVFRNQRFDEIYKTLRATIQLIRKVNPSIRFLLTVSPVPLTATNSGNHVLLATTESKSILRAVAGQMAERFRYIDYFPSYEIISSAPYGGAFYEANKRSVKQDGVDHVMSNFFACQYAKFGGGEMTAEDKPKVKKTKKFKAPPKKKADAVESKKADDLVCEEELLGAFGN